MKELFIKIDSPCSENWEDMTPNNTGRFCENCSKTVIDLVNLNSNEISSIFKKHTNHLCIRATSNQLEDPIIQIDKSKQYHLPYSKIAAGLIVASTLTSTGYAQQHKLKPKEEIILSTKDKLSSQTINNTDTQISDNSIHLVSISGKITGKHIHTPIENAKISLVTLDKFYITHSKPDGTFNLKIPNSVLKDKNIIRITYDDSKQETDTKRKIEYRSEKIIISKANINKPITILAKELFHVLGGAWSTSPPPPKPIVFISGQKTPYRTYLKRASQQHNSCSISSHTYHFNFEEAAILYGENTNKRRLIIVNPLEINND